MAIAAWVLMVFYGSTGVPSGVYDTERACDAQLGFLYDHYRAHDTQYTCLKVDAPGKDRAP